jgi:hypothetical protein
VREGKGGKLRHFREWLGIGRRGWVLAFAGLLAGLVAAAPAQAATATATIYVAGTVSCQWHAVVGVWVESGGGGSGWADWHAVDKRHPNIAVYQAKIQHTSLPTNIRLHVGCGGSASAWWSDNLTGSTNRAGGALTGSDLNLNAVCNEPETARPAPGDNERCWFGYASAAAAWAVAHLSGPGSQHALPGDNVGSNPKGMRWYGMCLAFADSAYWTTDPKGVSPNVSSDAAHMYAKYEAAGLVHSADGTPPVGALVFYPTVGGSEGHIGISVGQSPGEKVGQVISANEKSPSVLQLPQNHFGAGTYKGWAYPTTAFR